MRKIFGYIILALCILIYVVSISQKLTDQFGSYKTKNRNIMRSDRRRYGDLYGLAYLSYFRKIYTKPAIPQPVKNNTNHNINLYGISDSYIWSFFNAGKFYWGVDKFELAKTNFMEKLNVRLDSSKMNILLLEFSERNLVRLLNDTAYVKDMISLKSDANKQPKLKAKTSALRFIEKLAKKAAGIILNNKTKNNFSNTVNANIELNIWDFSIFTPLKEFKADINYKLFGAVNNNVYISKDGKQLFLNKTIDTTKITSSFKYISDKTLDTLVNRLNWIYDKSKKMGFDKTYLSILPNPISILDPQYNQLPYNHLVERVQNSPNLRVPYINLLPDFIQKKNDIFFKSDSHWNWAGAQIWLDKFNNELIKISKKTK